MTNPVLDRLREERDGHAEFIETLMTRAAEENRDLVATELDNIKAAEQRIAELEAQAEPIIAFEKRRASAAILDDTIAPARQTASVQVVAEHRSLGELWTESEQFRAYSGRGSSDVLHIEDFAPIEYRAATDPIMTNADPGQKYLPNPQKVITNATLVPHPLLGMVGSVELTSNAIDWLVVGEATGADVVAEGAKKPAISWTETTATFKLETIAGWKKYTRQAAEDIPALRSIIDQKIRRAIDNKLNEKAVAAVAGAKVAGNTTTGASKAPMLEVVRTAVGALQGRGYAPSAIALSPEDAAAIDVYMLGKTLNGAVVNSSVFGVPVVPVVGLTAGTAVVGDINDAITYFYKRGLSLYTTDSDVTDGAAGAVTSDFRTNVLTTLGEVRGVFGATDAAALQFAVVTP